MEKQLIKFIRKEILKEVSALGAIASEAGQVSVNVDGWELPPGGFKPIENVVDTLKLQLLDQQERVEHMNEFNTEKIPEEKYRQVMGNPVEYDEVQRQTKEFVGKYTNKTNDMKIIGESTMKISENKLRSLIRQEIVNLVSEENPQETVAEVDARQFKSGKVADFGASFGAKDRGSKVGKRSVKGKVKGSAKSVRGKKPGGSGFKGGGRGWTYRPVVKGSGFEKGGASFTNTLRKGGATRVKMENDAATKAVSDTKRWNELLTKAQKSRDRNAQKYFELQVKINDSDTGTKRAIRDAKWEYVTAGADGNKSAQVAAISKVDSAKAELQDQMKELGDLGKAVNWAAYDTGGKKKK
jgi:hypothetical protein